MKVYNSPKAAHTCWIATSSTRLNNTDSWVLRFLHMALGVERPFIILLYSVFLMPSARKTGAYPLHLDFIPNLSSFMSSPRNERPCRNSTVQRVLHNFYFYLMFFPSFQVLTSSILRPAITCLSAYRRKTSNVQQTS